MGSTDTTQDKGLTGLLFDAEPEQRNMALHYLYGMMVIENPDAVRTALRHAGIIRGDE